VAKIKRHFAKKRMDDATLRRLWPSRMTECAMAKQMGHSFSTLRRRAIKLGLPSSRREIWKAQP
jgi:hypothetical protein